MAIKYIPYIPEPIEGQAVLNNFNRVLRYRGMNDVYTSVHRGMPYYELGKTEKVGDNPLDNMVIRGECVSACAYLKDKGVKVDLVYIDPPFASGADYAKKVFIRRNPHAAEKIKKAEQDMGNDELKSFEEKMYGDVWDKEKYLNWMYENLVAIKSVMSETATIYVHLDWHIGHYVKILLDEIFGEDHFVNEIIWHYGTYIGQTTTNFPRKHDSIFVYANGETKTFNMLRDNDLDSDANYKRWKKYFNLDNRICGNNYPKDDSKFDGYVQRFKNENGREPSTCDDVILDISGKTIDDVWYIESVNPFATERKDVDYATQKPEALLDRIIRASSDKGMLVADFFGGSGTTAAAAFKSGRRFIHCDVGMNSVQTTRDRLKMAGASFDVFEIKDGVQLYRNPVQTMTAIKKIIPGLSEGRDLDAKIWAGAIYDSRLGMIPVYVPDLKNSASKLLDIPTMNTLIHEAIPDLPSEVKKVIVYYVDVADEKEIRDFIKCDDSLAIDIELRDLKLLLDDVVVEDYVEFHVEQSHDDLLGGYDVIVDKFISDRVLNKILDFNNKCMQSSAKEHTIIDMSDEGLETIEYLSLDCTSDEGVWHSDSEIKIDKLGYVAKDGGKTKYFWDGKINSAKKPLRLKIRNICGDETVWPIELS